MTTTSAKLSLIIPTDPTTDPFITEDLAENWEKIDAAPGDYICTWVTRPMTWGAPQAGRHIIDTSSGLRWRWTGAAYVRAVPSGWLNGSRRTAELSTSLSTPVSLVSAAVTVPAGGRRVSITVSWPEMEADVGAARLYLFRDAAQLLDWKIQGDSDSADAWEDGAGGCLTYFEAPGEGLFTYSFQFSTIGSGTAIARAAVGRPISIDVVEV